MHIKKISPKTYSITKNMCVLEKAGLTDLVNLLNTQTNTINSLIDKVEVLEAEVQALAKALNNL